MFICVCAPDCKFSVLSSVSVYECKIRMHVNASFVCVCL